MSTARRKSLTKQSRSDKAEMINLQAHDKWEKGDLRSAFRLMKEAAKLGAYAAKNNIGYFYDVGIGVKRNRDQAMYWYRKSFREGGLGAANIGTIYRDEMKTSLALHWFNKAVELGDIDANLEVAKLLLSHLNDAKTASRHLKFVIRAKGGIDVTIDSQEQATALLKKIERDPSNKRQR